MNPWIEIQTAYLLIARIYQRRYAVLCGTSL